MVSYAELFQFVIMLCAFASFILALIVYITSNKK